MKSTGSARDAGTVLAARQKGAVAWVARISSDRGRLEVVGLVPASATATVVELLTEAELRALLNEEAHPHDLEHVIGESRVR